MDEERTIIHGCTPNMLSEIDEKYLPSAPLRAEGTYELFIRPESRAWTDSTYPSVRYYLMSFVNGVITFKIQHAGLDIGRRVISEEHRGAGCVMDLAGTVYPEIGELLAAQQ